MITDIYPDDIVKGLDDLGYQPAYMEDIKPGDEIAYLDRDYERPEEERNQLIFLTVIDVRHDPTYGGEMCEERIGTVIRFIGKTERGLNKPFSFGHTWAIYKK